MAVAIALAAAALVLVRPLMVSAQAPPQPACPAGTTLNATTGTCQAPVCAAGTTFSGGQCISPLPATFICDPPTVLFPDPVLGLVCASPPPPCPAGLTGPDAAGLCSTAATLACPAGETVIAQLGLCFPPPGSTGPASANGGNGGSARGGDGGRGGDGFAPQCNQNTNDDTEWWEEPPTLSCGAGGAGGDAGDAGISEGGDGGLAFTDGFL